MLIINLLLILLTCPIQSCPSALHRLPENVRTRRDAEELRSKVDVLQKMNLQETSQADLMGEVASRIDASSSKAVLSFPMYDGIDDEGQRFEFALENGGARPGLTRTLLGVVHRIDRIPYEPFGQI